MQPNLARTHQRNALWGYGKLSFQALLILILATGCLLRSEKRHLPEWNKTGAAVPLRWSDQRAPQLEPLISKHCDPFLEQGNGIGLAVAVISGSDSTIMTFGRASVFSEEPLRSDTLFEIGSITKTFTGLALAREIERGQVSLEDPIQSLMPTGLQLPQKASSVTFKHLTTHTSGFPPLPDNMSYWRSIGKLLKGGNPYGDYSEEQFCEAIRTMELWSEPGSEFLYSNFGAGVLGYLLSSKAGTNYEAYIKREVCEPFGMHDTTVTLTPEQAGRFAKSYMVAERKSSLLKAVSCDPWDLPNHLAGAGALRSSVSDLLKYLELNMHPAGPLATSIRASHREIYRKNKLSVGMNWMRSSSKSLGPVIWHNGATGGACSYIGFTEDGRFGVVILSNVSTKSIDAMAWAILGELAQAATAVR